jgi:Na+/proline symporter
LFIANEVPVGIAGLLVAGIFAAAQSTVSTSMNSTATAFLTDFLSPIQKKISYRSYLRIAQGLTFLFGIIGTILGMIFVDPSIKSLFDAFLKVIGLFMGVLGGLFLLGMLTRRTGGVAALCGAGTGAIVMTILPMYTRVSGYLFALLGVATCFAVGYLVGLVLPAPRHSIAGLTIYEVLDENPPENSGNEE